MRVMVLMNGDESSEEGILPDEGYRDAMRRYNEELVRAGVLLAAEGLHPTARGKRVQFDNARTSVIDGPFAESKEWIAGFWMLDVRDMDEAVEWVRRLPMPAEGGQTHIDIREIFEFEGCYQPNE